MKEKYQTTLDKRLLKASYVGDLRETLDCLRLGADVNCYDAEDGRTPLMHAAERGSVEIAKALLATREVNLFDKDMEGLSPVVLAFKLHELVKGHDNKRRYFDISNMIRACGANIFPEMPVLLDEPAHRHSAPRPPIPAP